MVKKNEDGRIKDKKGKVVTGREGKFTCPECGNEITGPWSFKMHLVNVHEFSRRQAGLREPGERKATKKNGKVAKAAKLTKKAAPKKAASVPTPATAPVEKAAALCSIVDQLFPGATRLVDKGLCPTCGKKIGDFRDEESRKEFSISGMCQQCQDDEFGQ